MDIRLEVWRTFLTGLDKSMICAIEDLEQQDLRLQYILMPQSAFQGRLHFHLAELVDGEVKVLEGFRFFIRVVLQ